MTLDSTFDVPGHAVARRVGEDMVILDLAGGRYLSLDPVGARIWELIGEGRRLREVCTTMAQEYDVPLERLETDVLGLAGELLEQGLIAECD